MLARQPFAEFWKACNCSGKAKKIYYQETVYCNEA